MTRTVTQKLKRLQKKATIVQSNYETGHYNEDLLVFKDHLLNILKDTQLNKQKASLKIIRFSSNWLLEHQNILSPADNRFVSEFITKSKSNTKLVRLPNHIQKRWLENEKIAKKNLKTMSKPFNIRKFHAPVETTITDVSRDRSELSQYLNEPVHLIGQLSNCRLDIDVRHHRYVKVLLTHIQYLPTNGQYAFKAAKDLPDHMWLDITNLYDKDDFKLYKNDYLAISGVVGEYQSKVTTPGHMSFWRTKYNVVDPVIEGSGQLKLEGDTVIGLERQPGINEDTLLIENTFISRSI